jgi:type II secretory pathway pseudopilin PulG
MKKRVYLLSILVVLALLALSSMAMSAQNFQQNQQTSNLVQTVREAASLYSDVEEAKAAGYGMFLGCVSGPQEGAMGVHYPNGDLVGDGLLDPTRPEVLVYEIKNGRHNLVAVEFLVLAEAWDANNDSPPVLMGQSFHYAGSPNRYGLPAFYELHVWAWKTNPHGAFTDWNPNVSCEEYSGETMPH